MAENQRNRTVQRNNKIGIKGIRKKGNKYSAQICLGTFDTLKQAEAAYETAAKKLHGDFYYGKRR